MKKIIYTTLCSLLISGTISARNTKTFGSIIEFSYDATRNHKTELEAFNQYINEPDADLVVVDFYSPPCEPCKKLGLCIADLAQEFPSVKFIKVNINTHESIANKYRIRSVPQLFFFKEGSNKETLIGAENKEVLKSTIRKWAF